MPNKILNLTSDFEVKAVVEKEDDIILIEGYANTTEKDRVGDVIVEEAWTKGGMDNYLLNPIILAYHNKEKPIGSMVDYGVNAKGLRIVAEISKAAGDVYELIKSEILKTFSVGFRVKDADYDQETDIFVIKDLELYEISVVSVPANAGSTFSLRKCLENNEYEEFKKEYNHMPEAKDKAKDTTDEVITPSVEDQIAAIRESLEKELSDKLEAQSKNFNDTLEAAVELALEGKETHTEDKEKETMPDIKVTDGAEALIKELTDRLEKQDKSLNEALDGLRNEIVEKNTEIEALTKSKMHFENPANKISEKEIDDAILVAKILGLPLDQTKAGKKLIEKSGAQHIPGSADASDWEKEFSRRIENDMRDRLVVEPLFNNKIVMNTYAMQIPINPEADLAEWIPTTGFRSSDGSSTGTAVDHVLTDTTLKAYKLASKEYIGYEEEEDAIIPIVPVIRDATTRRMARSSDIALLRGAQGGATTTDPIIGLAVLAATTGGAAQTSNAVGTPVTVAQMQTVRRGLGRWGLNPGDVMYVVSQDVYYDLLEDADFRTIDVVGDRATILTGQIGFINGSPVVVSGEFEAKAATKHAAVAVNMSNFILGNLRSMMVERDRDIVNQKNVIVATRRMGMIPLIADAGTSVLTWSA